MIDEITNPEICITHSNTGIVKLLIMEEQSEQIQPLKKYFKMILPMPLPCSHKLWRKELHVKGIIYKKYKQNNFFSVRTTPYLFSTEQP